MWLLFQAEECRTVACTPVVRPGQRETPLHWVSWFWLPGCALVPVAVQLCAQCPGWSQASERATTQGNSAGEEASLDIIVVWADCATSDDLHLPPACHAATGMLW
jgi:hypothetical protein